MLDVDEAKQLLDYDKTTGIFTWKISRGNKKKGEKAGSLSSKGYVQIGILGKRPKAQNLAFAFVTGKFPSLIIDHINGDPSDNRWCNLRECSQKDNVKNAKKNIKNTSGHTGVSWYKQSSKWVAYINVDGKSKRLGYFSKLEDAIAVRQEAEIKYNYHVNHGRR